MRQGPHHSAQKSTRTSEPPLTVGSKFSALSSTVAMSASLKVADLLSHEHQRVPWCQEQVPIARHSPACSPAGDLAYPGGGWLPSTARWQRPASLRSASTSSGEPATEKSASSIPRYAASISG